MDAGEDLIIDYGFFGWLGSSQHICSFCLLLIGDQFVYLAKTDETLGSEDGQFQLGCRISSQSLDSHDLSQDRFVATSEHGFIVNPKAQGKHMIVSIDGAYGTM